MAEIWGQCEEIEEYLGSAVGYLRAADCVVVKEGGFRSRARELETWQFILEQYSRYDTDCIVFDLRDSIYPEPGPALMDAFRDMAQSLPRSHVGFLSDNRQPEILRLSKQAIESAGHTCIVSDEMGSILKRFEDVRGAVR